VRKYVPDKKFLQTHPEYFATRLDGTPNAHMPSLTHPDVPKLVADKIKAEFAAAGPATGGLQHMTGIAPDDGIVVDHSEETMKINQGFVGMLGRVGDPRGLSTSEEWFRFINKVAAEVVKDYPDAIISTNGYANRDIPPQGVKLHPNLAVMYAAIWADTLKPFTSPKSWHGAIQGATLKRWCELNKRVFLYDYNYNMIVSMLTPTPTVSKLRVNIPLMKKWGVFGFFDETRQAYMEHGITTRYIRAKMFWDADLDVDRALDDFFQKWYGKAAKPAAAFWGALERRMQETPLLGHEDRILPYVYTPELVAELEEGVAQAEKLADTDRTRLHVKVDRHILEHLKAYMAMHEAEFNGRYSDAVRQADVMLEHRRAINAINPFFHVLEGGTGAELYRSGVWYWGIASRKAHYQKLHDMTSGKTGTLVAMAPKKVSFKIDDADEGRYLGWYAPDHNRRGWEKIDTTVPFYLQGHMNERGIPYGGNMWYVFELKVPRRARGKAMRLYSPVVLNEAWIWMNGEYVGYRREIESYYRPAPIDFDVTDHVQPAKRNIIAVRVNTGQPRSQAPEGFQGRLFLYTPVQ